jgi:hypothetical protein
MVPATWRTLRPQPLRKYSVSNSIAAHKHRTRLHVLRDRLKRAVRDQKRGLPGAKERVAAHSAKRAAYRASHP